LEAADATLAELLYSRYNTTKLFTEEDIFKLAESVLYTLSFLQSKKVSYVDLCQENIYYDAQTSSFKLLPIELIKDSAYELAKSGKRFSLLAPELVLALRYGESEIEEDIQDRSNVFTLGMILLEALTLLPSKDCYDGDSYDILDEMVTSRLDTVREFYPEFLTKLI
jgi:serine/threonine protein kinase